MPKAGRVFIALSVTLILLVAVAAFVAGGDGLSVAAGSSEYHTLRVYGRANQGAGSVGDPDLFGVVAADVPDQGGTGLHAEDPAYVRYAEPIFNPQLRQAPVKDSVTFNPAFMSEFETFDENHALGLYNKIFAGARNATEKVWFRMWYEPWHWDKDLNANDELDIDPETEEPYAPGERDEWYPAVMQEFTYMLMEADLLANKPEPLAGQVGRTSFVFPVGMREEDLFAPDGSVDGTSPNARYGYGLTSLDGDFDGVPDTVYVESELTLFDKTRIAADFDGDGDIDSLDPGGDPLSGDELAILRLATKERGVFDAIQFLDHMAIVKAVFDDSVLLDIWYTGDMIPTYLGNKTIFVGDMLLSGNSGPGQLISAVANGGDGTNACDFPTGPWFVYLDSIDTAEDEARLMVGRALGATFTGMEDGSFQADTRAGDPWFLKRFYVDGHEYNVVAIKTDGGGDYQDYGCDVVDDWPPPVDPTLFKFITLRTPIPKEGTYDDPLTGYLIEQHSVRLQPYAEENELSVLPPFNHEHYLILDVQAIDAFTCDEDDVDYFGTLVGPVPPILQQNGPFPYQGVGPHSPYHNKREMALFYIEEDKNWQYLGELKEKYGEIRGQSPTGPVVVEEFWYLEQFHTLPWEYTEFVLPDLGASYTGLDPDLYLLTSAFEAPESEYVLWTQDVITDETSTFNLTWDGDEDCWVRDFGDSNQPMPDLWSPRVKFWFDPSEGGKKYKDDEGVRVYGFDSEGPGFLGVEDPEDADYPVEVKPYTDPFAPFNPNTPQAPRKDSLTFNPAYLNEFIHSNESLASLYRLISIREMNAYEKVFFRMWYEPEYLDKILQAEDTEPFTATSVYTFPAAMQEFTYMFLDTQDQPASAQPKSSAFAFPMATGAGQLPMPDPATKDLDPDDLPSFGWGLTSFDANFDGQHDIVQLHSENSLSEITGIDADFDGDGGISEQLDSDPDPLSGNELVVFALEDMLLGRGDSVQFLDHMVTLENVATDQVVLKFWYTGGGLHAVSGGYSLHPDYITSQSLLPDEMAIVNRSSVRRLPAGGDNLGSADGAWFVYVNDINSSSETVSLIVGRALGAAHSAMDDGSGGHDELAGDPWYLKRFFVDGHEYNVVAIYTEYVAAPAVGDENYEFKFITIRTPVPKVNFVNYEDSQKLEGYFLGSVWGVDTSVISVMPPFNFAHTGRQDIQALRERDPVTGELVFANEDLADADCLGPVLKNLPPLEIRIVDEDHEPQFFGELKEKYYEDNSDEIWQTEQFHIVPDQYTEFLLPPGQLYLLTSNWVSDQSRLYTHECVAEPDFTLLGGASLSAMADVWPDCSWTCGAADVQVNGARVADAVGNDLTACSSGSTVAGYLWLEVENTTGADRYAPWVLFDVYVNGVFRESVATCLDDVIAAGATEEYSVDPILWNCGDDIELRNVVLSWATSGGTTCVDSPVCASRKAHCWQDSSITVAAPVPPGPPPANGVSGVRVQFLYDPDDPKDIYVNTWQGPGPGPTPTPTASPTPPPGGTGTITGKVMLQGRTNYSGATVIVAGVSGTTNSSGYFTLSSVPVGNHQAKGEMGGYLDHVKSSVLVEADEILVLPDVQLTGGDANNDCLVNVFDLVIVAWNYGSTPPSDPRSDINGNNVVDLFDLVMVGRNLDQACPGPWIAPSMAQIQAGGKPDVQVVPESTVVPLGSTFTISVTMENAAYLYGIDVMLAFGPDVLEVVDADDVTPGIQVLPGAMFNPDLGTIAANEADNVQGYARYAVALKAPAEPVAGDGTVFAITFRAKAAGTTELTLPLVEISNAEAQAVEAVLHEGTVHVLAEHNVYLPVIRKASLR